MTDDEFSSWFTHDGGPCPLTVGTVHIRELQKALPGKPVIPVGSVTIVSDSHGACSILATTPKDINVGPNSWEWKYFKTKSSSTGLMICKVIRYRVKKSPGVKLLESLVKDPPIDLIRDPERKLLEYHPS